MAHPERRSWIVLAVLLLCVALPTCGGGGGGGSFPPPEAATYIVGGTLSGLRAGKSLVLRVNGGDDTTLPGNGRFEFDTPLADGADYAVRIRSQPDGQQCAIRNASGTVEGADVTNVAVTCSDRSITYMVGGTLAGLGAGKSLILRVNGGDDTTLQRNGRFELDTPLADGADYAVSIRSQPDGQQCAIRNAGGTVDGADVTNVAVTCSDSSIRSGSLDPTFGRGSAGFAISNSAAGGRGNDLGQAMAIDAGGRIVVTGYSRDESGSLSMALWRLRSDGSLDTSFNGVGYATHPGAPGGATETIGTGVAVDAKGRIVVAGYSIGDDALWGVAVWRYLPTGQLDTSFNRSGFVRSTAPRQGGGVGVALDEDGRILVSGFTYDPDRGFNIDMTLWRFKADGTPDTSFNGSGRVVHASAAGGSGEDIAVGLALDRDERILVTGYSTNAAGNQDLALWRYDDAGRLDTSFNGKGFVTLGNPAGGGTRHDVGRTVGVDSSGRIVVTGWTARAGNRDALAIWRFNGNGARDTSFNSTGLATRGGAGMHDSNEGRAAAVDGKGRILVAGSSTGAGGDRDMALWRYDSDGSPDTTFNGSGVVVLSGSAGGNDGDDGARDVAIDGTGRVVVTGYSTNPAGNRDTAVWRIVP